MRKLIACFLLVSYVSVSTAGVLNLHYCEGGWMTGVNMMQATANDGHCLVCHQRQMDKNCCHHPKIQVKISPNQLLPETHPIQQLWFLYIAAFPPMTVSQGRVFEPSLLFQPAHAPPGWLATANTRQAFYGVFLI